jgi:hypothetical protein
MGMNIYTHGTNSSNGRNPVLVRSLVQLESLHTSANLEYRARVGTALVVFDIFNLFQTVRPDAQRALTD